MSSIEEALRMTWTEIFRYWPYAIVFFIAITYYFAFVQKDESGGVVNRL